MNNIASMNYPSIYSQFSFMNWSCSLAITTVSAACSKFVNYANILFHVDFLDAFVVIPAGQIIEHSIL